MRPPGAKLSSLAYHQLFEAAAQLFKNLLLALLYFKQDWLGKPQVILRRMNLARLQKDLPEVGDAFLRE